MSTLDAMKQAARQLPKLLDCDSMEDFGATFDHVEDLLCKAIAHEEAREAKLDTDRNERLAQLESFCLWEREHHPGKQHIAEWALAEIGRLHAEVADSGVEAGKKQAQQGAVPPGWKLVPIEPTEVMLLAMLLEASTGELVSDHYKSMLAAAPQPPQGEK